MRSIYGPVEDVSTLDECNGIGDDESSYRYHVKTYDQVDETADYCNGDSSAIQWGYVLSCLKGDIGDSDLVDSTTESIPSDCYIDYQSTSAPIDPPTTPPPTSAPVTAAPVVAHVYRLAELGETCTDACTGMGKSCSDANHQDAITIFTEAEMEAMFVETFPSEGIACDVLETASNGKQVPRIVTSADDGKTYCYPIRAANENSVCAAKSNSYRRICGCF